MLCASDSPLVVNNDTLTELDDYNVILLDKQAPPLDTGNRILLVSFVYGVAILAPWNAVLSTLDFFTLQMPHYPISFVVSFAINGVMVLVVTLCLAYPEKGSHAVKVNGIFFVTSIILLLLPFWVVWTDQAFGEKTCFWLTCFLLAVIGSITAISQSAVLSYMSRLPDQKYMAVCSLAMGVSALLQNALYAVVLASFNEGSLKGTLTYYCISAAFVLFAALMYFVEARNPFAKQFSKQLDDNLSQKSFMERLTSLYESFRQPF
jgi:heme/copper-type cytochrome/quinol oxidase subunit 4